MAAWLGTGGGSRWLANRVEDAVGAATAGGSLRIGALDPGLRRWSVSGLVLTDAAGRELLGVDRIDLRLDPLALLGGALHVPRATARGVRVSARQAPDGTWDWARTFPPSGSDAPLSTPLDVRIDALEVLDVDVAVETPEGPALSLSDGVLVGRLVAHRTTFDLSELSAEASLDVPGLLPIGAWGGVQWDSVRGVWLRELELAAGDSDLFVDGTAGRSLQLAVAVDRLEGADVGALLGRPLAGSWSGSATVSGPPSEVSLVASLGGRERGGSLALVGRADLEADPPRWSATAELAGLQVDAVDPSIARPVVLGGIARLEGTGTTRDTVDAAGTWQGGQQVLYGQDVAAVDARFRVREGGIDLAPSRVEGVLGSMTLQGRYGLVDGALDVTVASDLSPGRLAALGTAGLDGSGAVQAAITRVPGSAAVRVTGTARYAPFVYGPDVRVAALVAPFDVTVEDGETRGTFDLAGAAATAYGATAAAVEGRALSLRRGADGRLEVAGVVRTPRVAYGRWVTADAASTALSVRMAGGHRAIEATTTVGPHALVDLPAGGGVVFTTVVDDRVRAEVHLGTGPRSTLDTVARYDLATGDLALDALSFAPTPRATWTAVEPVTLRVVEGGMAGGRVHVRSGLGEIEIRGDLATAGPVDGAVRVRGLELDHVTELWPDDGDLSGRLDLDARITGTAEAPVVAAEVAAERVFASGNVRWLDVAGRLSLADGALSPALDLAADGEPLARVTGRIPMLGGLAAPALDAASPAAVHLAVLPGTLARMATVLPALDGTPVPSGRWSARIDADGPLRDPEVRIAGVAELEAPGFSAPLRAELDLRRRGDDLTFVADLREDLRLRATLDGGGRTRAAEVAASLLGLGPEVDLTRPETWLDDLRARVVVASLPAAGFGALAGAPPLGGDLVGSFRVSGSPSRPVVDGGLAWIDATLGGQPLGGAHLGLRPEDGGYQLEAVATLPDGGGVEVRGRVPVAVDLGREASAWSTGPLDLQVSGPGIPVTLLGGFDPSLRGVAGLVAVTGSVGGALHDPRPDLAFAGRGLAALYRPLLLATEGARLEATLTAERVTFDARVPTAPARAFTTVDLEPGAEPRIRLQGEVALSDWSPSTVDARVRLFDGAWVAATDLTKIRTTGDLRVDGRWPALRVRGDLALVQGLVGYETAAAADAAPLAVDEAIRVVRPAVPPPPPPPVEEPLALDVAVDVDLGRNLQFELSMPFVEQLGELGAQVSRVDLSTRVGGRVKVRADAGSPTLVGELELIDGTVRLMRSSFDLQEGHVVFAGGDPYEEAELDVSARMQVSGAALDLRITGTPVAPSFELVSEEYPDPTEQMVILVTGSAPDELTADQGAGAALSLLWSSAFAGMRLGSFSIEPSGAVRLGIPVSRRLYTSTTWSLSQDPTVNQLTFEADWSLSRHVVVNGALGDRQSWGDLYWEVRF